jgi:hypothetical protein
MKKLLLVLMLALPALAFAQSAGPTPPPGSTAVAQSSTRNDAATSVSTSSTSAQTMTLTPTNGGSVVIYSITVQNCAGGTAVTAAAPTNITTTGLSTGQGTNNGSLSILVGSGVTAGLCQPLQPLIFPTGLRAAAPGNVTFVLPTFATNQTISVSVAWASAP